MGLGISAEESSEIASAKLQLINGSSVSSCNELHSVKRPNGIELDTNEFWFNVSAKEEGKSFGWTNVLILEKSGMSPDNRLL